MSVLVFAVVLVAGVLAYVASELRDSRWLKALSTALGLVQLFGIAYWLEHRGQQSAATVEQIREWWGLPTLFIVVMVAGALWFYKKNEKPIRTDREWLFFVAAAWIVIATMIVWVAYR